jgi:hypothetical protein
LIYLAAGVCKQLTSSCITVVHVNQPVADRCHTEGKQNIKTRDILLALIFSLSSPHAYFPFGGVTAKAQARMGKALVPSLSPNAGLEVAHSSRVHE